MQAGAPVPEPKLLHRLEGHKADIFTVAFSPDGSRAVTGSYDKDLRLWQVSDGAQIALMAGHGDKVLRLAVRPRWDDRQRRYIRRYPALGWARRAFLAHLGETENRRGLAEFQPRRQTPLGDLRVWRLLWPAGAGHTSTTSRAARWQLTYSGHDNAVYASAFSPDGHWVATGGGANYEIHLWDPHTGERRLGSDGQPLRLGGQGQLVWSAGFSTDGRRIGWGNRDACPEKPQCPNEQITLQQALTLPLGGDATLGAPEALTRPAASSFRRAAPSSTACPLRIATAETTA